MWENMKYMFCSPIEIFLEHRQGPFRHNIRGNIDRGLLDTLFRGT